jgi:hypothetical protein
MHVATHCSAVLPSIDYSPVQFETPEQRLRKTVDACSALAWQASESVEAQSLDGCTMTLKDLTSPVRLPWWVNSWFPSAAVACMVDSSGLSLPNPELLCANGSNGCLYRSPSSLVLHHR